MDYQKRMMNTKDPLINPAALEAFMTQLRKRKG